MLASHKIKKKKGLHPSGMESSGIQFLFHDLHGFRKCNDPPGLSLKRSVLKK